MSRHRDWDVTCKVYIGNLGDNASREEIEDAFSKYGRLRNVWVARSPPGFAFVEFEDPRDAEDSANSLDGTRLCGNRVRVEMSNGQQRGSFRGRGRGRGGRERWGDRGDSGRDGRFRPGGRRDERAYEERSRSRSRDRGRRRRSPSYRSMSRSRSRSESPPRRGRGGGGRSRSGSRSE